MTLSLYSYCEKISPRAISLVFASHDYLSHLLLNVADMSAHPCLHRRSRNAPTSSLAPTSRHTHRLCIIRPSDLPSLVPLGMTTSADPDATNVLSTPQNVLALSQVRSSVHCLVKTSQ